MATDDPEFSRREVLGAGAALGLTANATTLTAAEGRTSAPHAPAKRPEPPIDFVCRNCGGNSVARDAWAEWDVAAQGWVLGTAFDDAFCHDCEAETRLKAVEAGIREG